MPKVTSVFVHLVDINKFYGVKHGYHRGFLTRTDFDKGCFTTLLPGLLTNGNAFNCPLYSNLTDSINSLLDNGFEVFEFDTFKELMVWVINDTKKG